ncbi:hypothetical protein MAPG_08173 [Magnaporthiopsis poae ATCC 64411]|uniref:NAD-dependent epimerase/dehydratase domain-containing protein n=1 Tax=Magnaporthiopsis poae (strain ATCC 64411 / 73-15) TaxID=644358 RepID=A0A0C4E6M9_MAGP6|nr:hypothetical protein MAPG_08173 [Magnaporthiopsis poae ATCC 64411]
MASNKILLTGATGYIGGTVLTTLLASSEPAIKGSSISVLVRKEEQAAVLRGLGVNPIIFKGLDDVEALRRAASEHDAVIHTASSQHDASAVALIQGLGDRKKATGKEVHFIHTGGTSALGDQAVSGRLVERRVFNDKTDDIFAYERQRQAKDVYDQRTTDLAILEAGEAAEVKTYIIMPPTIYGIGTGAFNRVSIQVLAIMRAARRDGFTTLVRGARDQEWGHVHVTDLAMLYELILARALDSSSSSSSVPPPPSGRKGLYFAVTGHHSWGEVADRVAREGHRLGYVASPEVREVPLAEAGGPLGSALGGPIGGQGLSPQLTEAAWASHVKTEPALARELGWKPVKDRRDFEESFALEWTEDVEGSRK